jgi:hypothetical protein
VKLGVGTIFGVLFLSSLPLTWAQLAEIPPIGTIDFFGLTIPESEALEILPISVGDSVADAARVMDRTDFAAALGALRGTFNFVCCNEGKLTMVYIGLTSSEQAAVVYHAAPTGRVFLPTELVERYDKSMDYLVEVVKNPRGPEDRSQGHSLIDYPPLRALQESFIADARDRQSLLVEVLHESENAKHRAVAAHVLGYAPDKKVIVPELVTAVRDPVVLVRNNATRAIGVIADYATDNPDLGIEIDGTVFVEMLNSLQWTDRNKALMVLSSLSRRRDLELLTALRTQALPALIEMCGWKNLGHAGASCRILERILGFPEQEDLYPRDTTLQQASALRAGLRPGTGR